MLPRPHVLIAIEGRHEGHRSEVAVGHPRHPEPIKRNENREPIFEGSPHTKFDDSRVIHLSPHFDAAHFLLISTPRRPSGGAAEETPTNALCYIERGYAFGLE